VFFNRVQAERACAELAPLGIAEHRVNVLTPRMTERELSRIPTIQAEQPGMGKALGAAVGGAVGLAGGMGVAGVALSSLVVRPSTGNWAAQWGIARSDRSSHRWRDRKLHGTRFAGR
jgi:hypothetical protein